MRARLPIAAFTTIALLGCADAHGAQNASPPRHVHSYVTAATWTHPSEGYRIRVRPSLYGRNHAKDAPGIALDQAVAKAGRRPLTITRSMRRSLTNQLRCHAVFAQHKPRWDLETWRPDVGYAKTVAHLCNP